MSETSRIAADRLFSRVMATWSTPRGRMWAFALSVCAASVCGCAEPAIGVRVVFPSEQTFLVSSVATIDVYDGEGSGERESHRARG